MPNLVTLLPFVFELSSKNQRGPKWPPTRAKVNSWLYAKSDFTYTSSAPMITPIREISTHSASVSDWTASAVPDGCHPGSDYVASFNPISGRLLATPISCKGGGGCLGPPTPLISPVLTGRILKFKRHSICLNMIYISKKNQKFVEGGIRGAKTMNFRYFFITYYRHVCEPILIQQVAIDRGWTGYTHIFRHFGKFKNHRRIPVIEYGVQKCKINGCFNCYRGQMDAKFPWRVTLKCY